MARGDGFAMMNDTLQKQVWFEFFRIQVASQLSIDSYWFSPCSNRITEDRQALSIHAETGADSQE